MSKLVQFLIQLLGTVLQAGLSFHLGKKQAEADNAEEALKDVQESNAIRDEVGRNSADGAIDERVRQYYVD